MQKWLKSIDWYDIGGYLVAIIFYGGLFALLFGQSIYDYFAPVYYKDCKTEIAEFKTIEHGKDKSKYEISKVVVEGKAGKKEVCKASKSGYENKETILEKPVDKVVEYSPTTESDYRCRYLEDCSGVLDEIDQRYLDEYSEYMESQYDEYYEPQGGGAICRDGTRSYSTGRGTCSWHGGVSQWLY